MKNLIFPITAALLLSFASCNQKASDSKQAETMKSESKPVVIVVSQLASAKDLFCGMPLENGSIADTTTYQGKVYGFCSTACKDSFNVNPASHLSQN